MENEMARNEDQCAYSHVTKCRWKSWHVSGERSLAVYLSPGNCTDMTGLIKVAKFLMPDVLEVRTFSGEKADTVYLLDGGKWKALLAKS